MLGEDICFFRDEKGQVAALTDYCPHRGARLSEGDCHYAGTVACPYHGWVFDANGKNVAVLSEGPNATVCGKPGTEAAHVPDADAQGHRLHLDGRGRAGSDRRGRAGGVLRAEGATSSSTTASTGARTGRSPSRTRWTPTSSTSTATTFAPSSAAKASAAAARQARSRYSPATASAPDSQDAHPPAAVTGMATATAPATAMAPA